MGRVCIRIGKGRNDFKILTIFSSEELHSLAPNTVRMVKFRRWVGHVVRIGRLQDTIRMVLQEICVSTRNFIDSTKD